MLLSVALLPETLFEEAEEVLMKEINKVKVFDQKIILFMDSFEKTWLKYPSHVSVYNSLIAANDGPESFHRHCQCRLVNAHPDVWTLIGKQ